MSEGIYLGKMIISPNERDNIFTNEPELMSNLQKYGIDRSLLLPSKSCDKCDKCVRRKYSVFGLIDGNLVTLGTKCAANYLFRECNICGHKYSCKRKTCDECDKEEIDSGPYKGKTFLILRRGINNTPQSENIHYTNYCMAILHGNPNSRLRRYLLQGYEQSGELITYKYFTKGYYTNCSIYHVYLMNHFSERKSDDHFSERKIDIITDEMCQEIDSKIIGKCILCDNVVDLFDDNIIGDPFVAHKLCDECDEKKLEYGRYKGKTYSSVRDNLYMYINKLYGKDDNEFVKYAKVVCTVKMDVKKSIINKIKNDKCELCGKYTEWGFHDETKSNVCVCDYIHILNIGKMMVTDGKYAGKGYTVKELVELGETNKRVHSYIDFIKHNGHQEIFKFIIEYHDKKCKLCQ